MSDSDDTSALFSIETEPEQNSSSDQILYYKELSILPEEDGKPSTRSRFRCFNCGVGEHNMTDCPEKYNRAAVSKNRAAFQLQRQMNPGLYNSREFKRYHIEVEGKIKTEAAPGVISDKLREALGIKENQLPPYIYRMRTLGYPPGWLEEAKISHSGINMLDTNGERVPDPEEEEGEIFISKTRFDFSKIIEYPGYNVWPPADTINETKKYGAPQMQYSHSKTAFVELLKTQMEKDVEYRPPVFDFTEDMDAEEVEAGEVIEGTGEFVPPLPGDHPPDLPPPPPEEPPTPPPPGLEDEVEVPKSEEEVEDGEDVEEEEEEEGEIVKEERKGKRGAKRSIEDEDRPAASKSARTSLDDSVHNTSGRTVSESSTDDYHTPNNTMNSSFGRVINIELGTPALKIHSPYTNLPPSENWRKGVSDVIDFENLPNSTGKYENLKSVLRSVRDKLNLIRAQSGGNS